MCINVVSLFVSLSYVLFPVFQLSFPSTSCGWRTSLSVSPLTMGFPFLYNFFTMLAWRKAQVEWELTDGCEKRKLFPEEDSSSPLLVLLYFMKRRPSALKSLCALKTTRKQQYFLPFSRKTTTTVRMKKKEKCGEIKKAETHMNV